LNLSLASGLVKKSANSFSDPINLISQTPLLTCSLMKWCIIFICFVIDWWIGFFTRFIALVLSQDSGIFVTLRPKSLSYCLSQEIWAQQLPTTMYSTSVIERATHVYFLLFHDIRLAPSKWHVPLVLFLSNFHLAKSESEYSLRLSVPSFRCHNPTLVIPLRYLRILFVALKWDSFGLAWNLAHMHTLNILLGLLAMR